MSCVIVLSPKKQFNLNYGCSYWISDPQMKQLKHLIFSTDSPNSTQKKWIFPRGNNKIFRKSRWFENCLSFISGFSAPTFVHCRSAVKLMVKLSRMDMLIEYDWVTWKCQKHARNMPLNCETNLLFPISGWYYPLKNWPEKPGVLKCDARHFWTAEDQHCVFIASNMLRHTHTHRIHVWYIC